MKAMPCQTEILKHMMWLEGSKKEPKTMKTPLRERFGEELNNASTRLALQISQKPKMKTEYPKLDVRQI